jgi:hypothetical protein
MDRFAVAVDGEALTVDTTKTVAGPPHGSNAYLKPPKGSACIEGG